ncbi:excalibur calcium-binding domain-containing protein [Psychrobacillus sp. FSL H8-0484]|uniref:excalibur calcium-binding domain-containing protein n=1 Tax=Psychrobacillus sp. FSL H8-0484 TaxID=2921390 RepID=UPI0030F992D9
MKRFILTLFSTLLIFGIITVEPKTTDAAEKTFKNCTELNKVYKGGVAIDAKVKNKGGKTKNKPTVSGEIYKLNESKDRDKDGIACEN